MKTTPLRIKKYVKQSLQNDLMRAAVRKATAIAVEKRQKLVDEIPYWEILRKKNHSYKREVIENLDRYLLRFESECKKNNFQVHWAIDSEEARRIVLKIAKENNVKKVVKSKSLTTEEIHLNSALIEEGIETIETDLGEYIVQLEGRTPSHLTMPALHLSRQDIGRLFSEKLGVDYTDDPSGLLSIARKRLRGHFLTADMGITGVNFGIAETGALCIIENEANAHLTVYLPRIHVAIMGIEKVIPSTKSLPYFLKVLPVSATGQKCSTYVNIIGGPTQNKFKEGPGQVHVILLDNGRSKILKDPELRESLFCIRCGACLNICPVYQQIGGHAYGWVYMGPIGCVLIPQYLGLSEGKYAPFLSSLCYACYKNCPVQIEIPNHLLKLRNRIVKAKKSMLLERIFIALWAYLIRHPKLYRFATWFPGRVQLLIPKGRSFPVPGYIKERSIGRFDSKGFRKRYYDLLKESR